MTGPTGGAPRPRHHDRPAGRPRDEEPEVPVLRTERLVLREFRDTDLGPFALMNADPVVMEQVLGPWTREQSNAFVGRIRAQWRACGWGLWALERRDSGAFIGYTGLWPVRFEARFQPGTEIGWRLAAGHWGRGFATEAARAAVDFAFQTLGWPELVSFTAASNARSRAVMERLGMRREPAEDFEHPGVPEGHPLRPHAFYRLTAGEWRLLGR